MQQFEKHQNIIEKYQLLYVFILFYLFE